MMKWGYGDAKKFIGGNPVQKIINSPREVREILSIDLIACNNYKNGLEAVKKIKKSVIKNLVITDTIDNEARTKNVKNIEVLPISGLMGEAIKRISNSTSVSDLFK